MPAVSNNPPNLTHSGIAPILHLARELEDGSTTSRRLLESCLERINQAEGEGQRTFRTVNTASALESAEALDRLREAGRAPSPLAGIPISVKDLFDVEGEQSLAGSTALRGRPVADRDAPCIARLRAAGFVLVGRTNMTEFAFSGLGFNPHYGTPRNPYDRVRGRIPGGSSSGAAVSVTDGMAAAGLGTDTGGSCRNSRRHVRYGRIQAHRPADIAAGCCPAVVQPGLGRFPGEFRFLLRGHRFGHGGRCRPHGTAGPADIVDTSRRTAQLRARRRRRPGRQYFRPRSGEAFGRRGVPVRPDHRRASRPACNQQERGLGLRGGFRMAPDDTGGARRAI